MCSSVFIVEDIESRQADVRDFFLTESNYRRRALRRCIACRTNGCPGRAARHRQRSRDSQYRDGFRPTPWPRSLLRMGHRGDLPLNRMGVAPSQTDCSKSAPSVLPLRGGPILRRTTAAGSGGGAKAIKLWRQAIALFLIAPIIAVCMAPPAPPAISL